MYLRIHVGVLVACSLVVGAVIGAATVGDAMAGSEGTARHVVALAGEKNGTDQALYIVDTLEQTVVVYEYSLGRGGLHLSAARSFKYDKKLEDFDISRVGGKSLRVAQVKALVH